MEKLVKLYNKKEKLIIGLMSGTSLDGIDAALVRVKNSGLDTEIELIGFETFPYTSEERNEINKACSVSESNVELICQLNFYLGKKFGEAAISIAKKCNIKLDRIDLVGSHGQTIYHIPQNSTLQIGEPSVIKEMTGITTVADFRVMDVAAGGHGAPLVPYTEYLLYRNSEKTIALQNIGGIGNVTILPKMCNVSDVIAFDTGPGNMMIDTCIEIMTDGEKNYDENGIIASKGKLNSELLDELMSIPIIKAKPPKTTGREQFGKDFTVKMINKYREKGVTFEDIVNTFTRFTVKSIAYNYNLYLKDLVIDEVVVSGGGSYNPIIMQMLKEELYYTKVFTQEEKGYRSDAKEAIAFAILANESISGNLNNLPLVTGAKKAVILGKIIP
ncbi:anhydro-N-acetylmuramic acid kinase AnmK [Anaerobranca gottschalkii]|uniref:Anhydro-N-acetylmuramic acid kinase n=1 Tax=Anaerobranca gottschalkii DSM 13577 TaxID=1120990 RepID=A0A1I0AP47_9FIRM|nr:anhydro-N-acetylmuramic acid kinase AnmK [Anaerobranca gottschalkii]SES95694.1 anhydro-N-acetylmuramic acid kinase [Anaerobranca gottschalkii DSM 13577]